MVRRFVSLCLFFTLIAMTISGIVLYIMPHGRVAYWTGWRFLGLDKDQWDNLHTVFGFLMVFFGIWHVVLNWSSIVNYIKGKVSSLPSKEFWLSAVVAAVVTIGTIANVPPFSFVPEFGEKIKNMWEKPKIEPPAPHAELIPLKKVAKLLGISPEEALKTLKERGIKVTSPEEKLKDIAAKNGITPARIYEILLSASPAKQKKMSSTFQPGSGIGRMTLREVCQKLGIPVNKCVEKLKRHGIKATPDKTLREIAFSQGRYPYEIVEILEGKNE
jgi:biotin operon repressor